MTENGRIEKTTWETIIVGGGPIGIELAAALHEAGADYLLLEGGQIGDAFMKWPPSTYFFSTPEHVAIAGIPVQTVDQRAITGEQYLAYLRMVVEFYDLNVRVYEPVTAVQRQADGFLVRTNRRSGKFVYRARRVVLATGGMAGPRLLHIPGEDLPHVSHYFQGPHRYFRTRLLVVGGRNSAVEAALRCWRAGAEVAMSYRRQEFNFERIKPHLSMDLGDRLRKGEIAYYPATVPVEITPTHVALAATEDGVTPNGRIVEHPCDFVLLATGFVADMSLFAAAGVALQGEAQAPVYDPGTMETNVPGLYVAGTAAGGTQTRFTHFISTTHDHVGKIVKAITGRPPRRLGTIDARNNAVTWEEVKAN